MAYPRTNISTEDYIGAPELSDRDAFCARIAGDTMKPRFKPGDLIIFSPAAAPRNGDCCYVRFEDGHTTFKRVDFVMDHQGKPAVKLTPFNKKYRPMIVPSEQITGLYLAVFKYERLDFGTSGIGHVG